MKIISDLFFLFATYELLVFYEKYVIINKERGLWGMERQNYYELLGISQTATQEEIKKAYRSKAIQWHPDNNQDKNATAMFQSIYEAYEVLSDLSSRKKYDNELRQENRNNVSTTESSSHAAGTTKKSYYSYTKTREESEFDFDDWLKEYLKRKRKKSDYNTDIDSLLKLKLKLKEKNLNIFNIFEENIKNDEEDKIYTLKF